MFQYCPQSSFQLSIGQQWIENVDTQSIKLQIYDWVIEMRVNNCPSFVELTHSIIYYLVGLILVIVAATPTLSSSISFALQR